MRSTERAEQQTKVIEESKYIKAAGRDKIYRWFLRITQRLSERQMLAILAVVVGLAAGSALVVKLLKEGKEAAAKK